MLMREIEVRYKKSSYTGMKISTPNEVYSYLKDRIEDLPVEKFYVLLLNNKNDVVGIHEVSQGTVAETIVHPREVFTSAIITGASSVIIVHNHPSGDLAPSAEDNVTTKRLLEAGKILGIAILDHIVVSNKGFLSYKEEGLM